MIMWRVVTRLLLLISCLIWTACYAAEQTIEKREIRVLLTFGGHEFEQKPFFAMFDNLPGIKYTRAPLPDSAKLLKPGLEKKYDVIVMYDMVGSISAEQRKAFVELLKTGIGVVALHHNLGAHGDWDEYPKIIGGKYLFGSRKFGDKEYQESTFAHDQDIDVKVADKRHPITRGITDFRIHDETYKHYYTSPDVHVLLTTDHPKSDPEIAWVTRYENSLVFYLLLGHDSKAWRNPVYPKLLLNGIRWASRQAETRRAEQRDALDSQKAPPPENE